MVRDCCKCLNMWDREIFCHVYCVKGKSFKMLQASEWMDLMSKGCSQD
jgi:uncharacterized protein Usg